MKEFLGETMKQKPDYDYNPTADTVLTKEQIDELIRARGKEIKAYYHEQSIFCHMVDLCVNSLTVPYVKGGSR